MPRPGGLSDKLGNYYEEEWIIKQILDIYDGKFDSILLEHPIVDDEFEFILKSNIRKEYHQVKRQKTEGSWTFKNLEKYFKKFYEIYQKNENVYFKFISTISATILMDLKERVNLSESFDSFNKENHSNLIKKEFGKFKQLLNISDEKAYEFINVLDFQSYGHEILINDNMSIIKRTFSAKPEKVHNFLLEYIKENIGKEIKRETIVNELKKFKPYFKNQNDLDKIKEINNDFINKIEYKTNLLIDRDEITEVNQAIKNKENIAILSDGGLGKSTFIHQIIGNNKEIDFLILDLEKYTELNDEIYKTLNLYVPLEFTLDSYENPLVIIDQMDIFAYVNSSNEEIYKLNKFLKNLEYFEIPFIITCREFNYKNNSYLSKLIDDRKNLTIINLKPFNTNQINEFLENTGINIKINSNVEEFLSIPLNLRLLYELNEKSDCSIDDNNGLYHKYWTYISDRFKEKSYDWERFLEYIFGYIEENEVYYIPLNTSKYKNELDFLCSENVMIKDDKGYLFFHENIFDYFYCMVFKSNLNSLKSYLLNHKQTLYSRRFVKIILEFEKEENYDKYIDICAEILNSEDIRIHIKVLVLDILNNISEINREFFILRNIIQDVNNKLHEVTWNKIYKNKEVWFNHFNKNNLIRKYHKSNLNSKINHLLIINKKSPDVAKLFLEKLNTNEEWNKNAMLFIRFASMDNEYSFKLLMKLIKSNIYSSNFNSLQSYYNNLSLHFKELNPSQSIDILSEFIKNIISEYEHFKPELRTLTSDYIDNKLIFNNIIENNYMEFTNEILDLMIKCSNLTSLKDEDSELKIDMIWRNILVNEYEILKTENGIKFSKIKQDNQLYHNLTFLEIIKKCMFLSIINVYYDDINEFNKIKEILIDSNINSFLNLLLDVYIIVDDNMQNIIPIIYNKKFFELDSFPQFIKKYNKNLNINEKEKFEKDILEYFKDSVKNNEDNEYLLLNSIDNPLQITKNRINELNKKYNFNKLSENSLKSFSFNISLEEAEQFNDDDWKDTFKKYNKSETFNIGPSSFWRVLSKLSEKEPLRFIKILENLNFEIHEDYYNAILEGIFNSELDFENTLRICKICHSLSNRPCGRYIIKPLTKFPEKLDNPECVDIINYYLIKDSNPSNESSNMKYFNNDYEDLGLNSVRGNVAMHLGNIFYYNQNLVKLFEDSLKKLVKDPCISVKSMAAYTLRNIYDNNLKIELFKELISDEEEELLKTDTVKNFLLLNIVDNFDELDYLIKKMINYEDSQININAGEIITYYSLRNNECNYYLKTCLNKNRFFKIGVLNTINYYEDIIDNEIIEIIIEKFLNEDEDDEEINSLISSCMDKFNENTILKNEELLLSFVNSNNNYNYWMLLHKCNKLINCSSIDNAVIFLKLVEIIINRFKEDEKFRELNRGEGIILECSELILKCYTDVPSVFKEKCLDIIDNILLLTEYTNIENKLKDYEENNLLR